MSSLRVVLTSVAVAGLLADPGAGLRAQEDRWRLDAGPLRLDLFVSRTATLFHVVDQISRWSQFSHAYYLAYFRRPDARLDATDSSVLKEHAALHKKYGWGGALERTFYTELPLDSALARAVGRGLITHDEAQLERRVMLRFEARVDRLMAEQRETLRQFAGQLLGEGDRVAAYVTPLARFVGVDSFTVPFYLIANPDSMWSGGGFNGGFLTLEITSRVDPHPSQSLVHELTHAFLSNKQSALARASHDTPGLDEETLGEALAYAMSPGLHHPGNGDPLSNAAARSWVAGWRSDSYSRFNLYGYVARPFLRDALADTTQTLDTVLPRITAAWTALLELDRLRWPNDR
jgi:hypothetical protein